MKSTTKAGTIVFKIEFFNAYCVSFNRSIDSQGGGLNSSMTISPEEITINGKVFFKNWVK